MINPLLAATDGYLPGRTPFTMATSGYLGAGAAVRIEYHGGGQRGDAWDLIVDDRELETLIMQDDDELMEIILHTILSGVLD